MKTVKPIRRPACRYVLQISALHFLLAATGVAQATGVPASHLEHLKRGVNIGRFHDGNLDNPFLSDCKVGAPDCTYTIERVAALGVDHARVLLQPSTMFKPRMGGVLDEQSAALSNLDRLVQKFVNRMGIIIALSLDEDQFKNKLFTPTLSLEQLETFWQELARHYSGPTYSEYVFFEILNEPGLDEPLTIDQWSGPKPPPEGGILAAFAHAIRAGAPQSTILVPGGEKADINGLLALQPVTDIDNVVYVIHYYEPFTFTHQGANWGDSNYITRVQGVRYPYAPEPAEKAATNIQKLVDKMNAWHDMETATKDRINTDLEIVGEWSKRNNNVPVICDEFGVYKKFSDPRDRAAWIGDVRSLLDKKGIRWTFWDYSSASFGFVNTTEQPDQSGRPDKEVVTALGLSGGSK